ELDIPAGSRLTGIRLQGNRQKTFYKGIQEIKTQALEPRLLLKHKLLEVKASLKTLRGRLVMDKEIWCSLHDKTFLPYTSQFLWRAMHNAHRVGHCWMHIPEYQDRATCQYWSEEESLKHILLYCKSPGAEIIRNTAERLWKERELNWPEVSLGSILGCGLVNFKNDMGRPSQSTRRLYKILMLKSAYMIWIICNDWVISRSGEPLTEAEIIKKWIFNINQRLQQDIMLANRSTTRNHPRLVATLVKETWSGILDEDKLPENWLKESRVLVGRKALTHNQLHIRGVG
ncbi:hypothetical protein DFH08DRAFT_678559, partial [Mycena albidolilacea]